MTVIRPNSVSGINSITVQSGNSLAIHKSNGELLRTITGTTGVSTFSSISVGTAYTDNSAAKSINIGVGASIAQHNDNTLTFGTAGDPRITIDASGDFNVGSAATIKAGGNATFSGIVTATSFKGDGSGLSGITGTTINNNADNRVITGSGTANTLEGESGLTFSSNTLSINTNGSSIAENNVRFQSSGKAYIDHATTGQDIDIRTSVSSSLDTTGITIKSTGNLAFASGKGIDFSATADGSGVSNESEVLDDYEEGQWTGAIVTGTANINDEWYVKIGRLVIGGGNITAISDTSSSNQINVTGLPFSVSGGESGVGAVGASKNSAFSEVVTVHVTGTTVYFMKSSTSTGSHDYLRHSDQVQSSGSLTFGFNYYTA